MSKTIILLLCSIAFYACQSSIYKYWDISKFNIQPGALKDNSEVKLLYTSQRPSSGPDCYVQLIAVSQENGDTFNILTAIDNDLVKKDSAKVFAYFDENNIVTKIQQSATSETATSTNYDSLSNFKVTRLTKVARDPRFDYLADNKFVTVIGTLGIRTMPK